MTESKQRPIGSKFNAYSTAAEVIGGIDLHGKTAIVTGGYSGIGTETTRALRSAGARVIVPARDLVKASAAGIDAEIWPMDLADPKSVTEFADRFLATSSPLHILVNSAGIMAVPLGRDARGYEHHFATNHLGHFQLVQRLWPALERANGARVVCVSSWGHRYSDIVWDDIQFERREYQPFAGYGQSKTANILHAVEIDRRGREVGIRAFALHPGSIVNTSLGRHIPPEQLKTFGVLDDDGKPIHDPSRQLKTVEEGASTSVWCAVSPELDGLGGLYCENTEVASVVAEQALDGAASTQVTGVRDYAIDPEHAQRLWTISERLGSRSS